MVDRARTFDTDAGLLTRIAAHDAAAFRLIVDRHLDRLHRIGYRLTGDQGAAEEVAQEALLRFWRDAATLATRQVNAGAWLTRVATNVALDRLRRRRFIVEGDPHDPVDEQPLVSTRIDAERERVAAVAAIAALPDRQRAAIVLTYYEDLSNAAAAEAMDMNVKAFESLLLRARTALRAALAPLRTVMS